MVVDFSIRKAPGCTLATKTLKGKWPGDKELRSEFESLAAWAKTKGLKTGKWSFREFGEMDGPPDRMRYEVGVELRGKGPFRGGKGVSVKKLPASTVVSITFDPDVVSPRVIYHGMADHIRWRVKAKELKEAGPYREVYSGNPWTSKSAWSHTRVEVPIKRLHR